MPAGRLDPFGSDSWMVASHSRNRRPRKTQIPCGQNLTVRFAKDPPIDLQAFAKRLHHSRRPSFQHRARGHLVRAFRAG